MNGLIAVLVGVALYILGVGLIILLIGVAGVISFVVRSEFDLGIDRAILTALIVVGGIPFGAAGYFWAKRRLLPNLARNQNTGARHRQYAAVILVSLAIIAIPLMGPLLLPSQAESIATRTASALTAVAFAWTPTPTDTPVATTTPHPTPQATRSPVPLTATPNPNVKVRVVNDVTETTWRGVYIMSNVDGTEGTWGYTLNSEHVELPAYTWYISEDVVIWEDYVVPLMARDWTHCEIFQKGRYSSGLYYTVHYYYKGTMRIMIEEDYLDPSQTAVTVVLYPESEESHCPKPAP